MDIVMTIPKNFSVELVLHMFNETESRELVKNMKVGGYPKEIKEGDKLHIINNGMYLGCTTIIGTEEKEFICSTTKRSYGLSKFIVCQGKLRVKRNMAWTVGAKLKGFQGFRYLDAWVKRNKPRGY